MTQLEKLQEEFPDLHYCNGLFYENETAEDPILASEWPEDAVSADHVIIEHYASLLFHAEDVTVNRDWMLNEFGFRDTYLRAFTALNNEGAW